jgi:hypothetical protein
LPLRLRLLKGVNRNAALQRKEMEVATVLMIAARKSAFGLLADGLISLIFHQTQPIGTCAHLA